MYRCDAVVSWITDVTLTLCKGSVDRVNVTWFIISADGGNAFTLLVRLSVIEITKKSVDRY